MLEAEKVMQVLEEKSNSEGTYCGHMKTPGKNVAQMQKSLNDIGNRIKSDFPDMGGGLGRGSEGWNGRHGL